MQFALICYSHTEKKVLVSVKIKHLSNNCIVYGFLIVEYNSVLSNLRIWQNKLATKSNNAHSTLQRNSTINHSIFMSVLFSLLFVKDMLLLFKGRILNDKICKHLVYSIYTWHKFLLSQIFQNLKICKMMTSQIIRNLQYSQHLMIQINVVGTLYIHELYSFV